MSATNDALDIDELKIILDQLLPIECRPTNPEDYKTILTELKLFNFNTEEALKQLISDHFETFKQQEASEARLLSNVKNRILSDELLQKIQLGIAKSYLGIIRGCLKLELPGSFEKYIHRFNQKDSGDADDENFLIAPERFKLTHDQNIFYKYVSIDTLFKVLTNKTLKWSSPELFNDPFDTHVVIDFDFNKEELEDLILETIAKTLASGEAPRGDGKSLYFIAIKAAWEKNNSKDLSEGFWREKMRPFAQAQVSSIFEGIQKNNSTWENALNKMRILCLSTNDNSIPMWAHYTGNHRGAMLVFENFETKANCFWTANQVAYSEQLPVFMSLEDITRHTLGLYTTHIPDSYKQFAYNKHSSWSYEEEWRIAFIEGSGHPLEQFTVKKEELASYVKFDPQELTEVRLGYSIEQGEKERLIDLISHNPDLGHVKVRQAIANRKNRKFDFD
ncbi:MAG: DUF2971 domain-containing protein [Bdellovibrionota bacterium]